MFANRVLLIIKGEFITDEGIKSDLEPWVLNLSQQQDSADKKK